MIERQILLPSPRVKSQSVPYEVRTHLGEREPQMLEYFQQTGRNREGQATFFEIANVRTTPARGHILRILRRGRDHQGNLIRDLAFLPKISQLLHIQNPSRLFADLPCTLRFSSRRSIRGRRSDFLPPPGRACAHGRGG